MACNAATANRRNELPIPWFHGAMYAILAALQSGGISKDASQRSTSAFFRTKQSAASVPLASTASGARPAVSLADANPPS
eukprot:6962283-Prymnesium_polylepis.1